MVQWTIRSIQNLVAELTSSLEGPLEEAVRCSGQECRQSGVWIRKTHNAKHWFHNRPSVDRESLELREGPRHGDLRLENVCGTAANVSHCDVRKRVGEHLEWQASPSYVR